MKLRSLLLIMLLLSAPALGATTRTGQVAASVTRTFNLEQLEDRPGILELNYNFVTVVDFESQILQIDSGNPALFELSVPDTNKNRVTLRAKQASGRTDLVVTTADNRQAFFTLNILSSGSGTVRYLVRSPAPKTERASPAAPVEGALSSPESSDVSEAPVSVPLVAPRTVSAAPRVTPATAPSGGSDVGVAASRVAVEAQPAASAALPRRGLFDLTTQSSVNLRGEVVVAYALNNLSTQVLRLDRSDLTVQQQGVDVPFTITPAGTITLGPKRSVYGRLTLQKAPTGPLTLRWLAQAAGGEAELVQVLDLSGLLGR